MCSPALFFGKFALLFQHVPMHLSAAANNLGSNASKSMVLWCLLLAVVHQCWMQKQAAGGVSLVAHSASKQ
jgi:hypothetical protein